MLYNKFNKYTYNVYLSFKLFLQFLIKKIQIYIFIFLFYYICFKENIKKIIIK